MSEKLLCKRCGFVAARSDSLKKHLKRKNICLPKLADVFVEDLLRELPVRNTESLNKDTNTYDCEFCGRQYNSCAGKSYHVKRCPKNKALIERIKTAPLDEIQELRKEIIELRQKSNKLELIMAQQREMPGSNNNINSNNSITNNINILDFGKENTSTLSHEFLKDCLFRCQPIETLPDDGENGIIKLIKHIHSIPENKNVRIRNQNLCIMEKRLDNKWVAADKNAVLNDMICKGYQIIDKFKSRHRSKLENDDQFEGIIEEIDDYLDEIAAQNKHVIGSIKRDVYIMLINDKNNEIVLLERVVDENE